MDLSLEDYVAVGRQRGREGTLCGREAFMGAPRHRQMICSGNLKYTGKATGEAHEKW